MSKLKLEDDFEDDATRFRQKNENVVKKIRDKKQKVWSKGEMFKVTWSHFIYEKWNSYHRVSVENLILISLSDSDQFTTFEEDTLQLFRYEYRRYDLPRADHAQIPKGAPAYRLFPFMNLNMEVVWFVLKHSEDPIKDVRSIFSSSFKKL